MHSKDAIIVSIYKVNGKNPLLTKESSVIGKVFERITLTPLLAECGTTQSAYQAGLSPTEVVQEAIRSHIQHGSRVYQCFYDLEKAFDSVFFCYQRKMLENYKLFPTAWFRVNKNLTKPFIRVRQGSVLFPMLFLVPCLESRCRSILGLLAMRTTFEVSYPVLTNKPELWRPLILSNLIWRSYRCIKAATFHLEMSNYKAPYLH